MVVKTPPESPFASALRQLDDLMTEASYLRERIAAALYREHHPFFPERRHSHQRYEPERRQFDE
jgi:hypothetical protein